ncbi:MAG: CmcJ/NvfI family oxidoreductase [Hyphomonadaceae bacterium]
MSKLRDVKHIVSHQVSGTVTADLNYIRPDATMAPKVIYSGGAAPQSYNEAYKFMPAKIRDGRQSVGDFKIHVEGFELVTSPTMNMNFVNDELIKEIYYNEVAGIVRKTTGAKDVFVFDHTVRRGQAQSVRKPAHHVHNDYTATTGVTRSEQMIGSDAFAEMKGRRMIQINVWRPLSKIVQRSPLAFCDAASIEQKDLIPTKIHFTDNDYVGEIFALRKAVGQQWYYFSEMTHDEVVLIKGYDTLSTSVSRFTPHTAFEYPDQDPTVPPRESIETRTFAFY